MFSTSIQLGENTGAVEQAVKRAVAAKGPQVTDRDLIEAIYAERGREGAQGELVYFRKSKDLWPGLRKRFKDEKQKVLATLGDD